MSVTLTDILVASVRRNPGTAFLLEGMGESQRSTLTYEEFYRESEQLARSLVELGLGRGDRIALMAPNQPEWVVVFFAAARIGAPVVTINPRYRGAELDYMLTQSGARFMAIGTRADDTDLLRLVQDTPEAFAGIERFIVLPDESQNVGDIDAIGRALAYSTLLEPSPGVELDASPGPFDPALILYTSGTTGRPKGAVITHASIIASAQAQAEHLGFDPRDVLIGHLPLNHVGGITCTIMAALISGASVVLVRSFRADAVIKTMARHSVTILAAVPTMYALLFLSPEMDKGELASVRMCVVGGSSVTLELYRQIAARFPNTSIINLYGLSETSGACILSSLDDTFETVTSTLGRTIGDFQARIVDAQGALLDEGEVGELQIKGRCVADGYWDLVNETDETFKEDGWLATGDIAKVLPTGHLALFGRKKEMYIQGGYNVYPAEVESEIANYPGVLLVAGIGVEDPILGEVGKYFIEREEGAMISGSDLKGYLNQRIADYKIPKYIEFVDALPLTASGKVDKAFLKERESQRRLNRDEEDQR
ncbi:MAG: class I adenylate-forming enzyme family protein [Ferrimicrobium sp.]|uniref:Class I adenylate-forming enzyme family protein n=1 Tax=Ferrimicrobium acidiphilum TaxID=121039 RepID=A0ABV3XZU6_9ACTN|nr:AMP-binding protein [Actinomycetota bacterium]